VSVHKVGYFADRPQTLVRCIFSHKGCENAVFKEACLPLKESGASSHLKILCNMLGAERPHFMERFQIAERFDSGLF
jgi:hypothetical protein